MSEPSAAAPDHAHVLVPPPAVYLLGILAGLVLQRTWPLPRPPLAIAGVLGWACVAGWALIGIPAVVAFIRARTSIVPIQPSSVLVESGPYRLTRNPMYLGLALLQAGLGLLTRQPWVLLMLVPVVIVIDRAVIVAEERYLGARFGDAYRGYRSRVRRWI